MHMLYNSDSYAVVLFELPADAGAPQGSTGGYEIVDKFAAKETFISGALAETFKSGVEALIQEDGETEEDEMDAYIERFTALMQQPLILH